MNSIMLKKIGQLCSEQYKYISALLAFLSSSAISIFLELGTTNVITMIMAFIFYYFFCKCIKEKGYNPKIIGTSIILGLVFSFFVTLQRLDGFEKYSHFTTREELMLLLLILIGLEIVLTFVLIRVFTFFSESTVIAEKRNKTKNITMYFIFFLIIILCWLPYYLRSFPGVVPSDSIDQISQMLTGVYSNHHPVAHTWFVEVIMIIGIKLFGTLNASIAFYSFIQMIIIAAVFAYTLISFYKYNVKRWICIVALFYYACIPYNVMFSFTIWKDSLFSTCILLFVTLLWNKIMLEKQDELQHKNIYTEISFYLFLFLSGIGICLFRTNGFYAYLVTLPFLCFVFYNKNRLIVIVSLFTLICVIFFKGSFLKEQGVKSVDIVESLSIPVQQVARVIYDDGVITKEQEKLLNEIIAIDQVSKDYQSYISDPIKNLIREKDNVEYLEQNRKEYLKLWVSIGINNPIKYVKAYIDQTKGYWYPDVDYWRYTDGVCENSLGVKKTSLISDEIGKKMEWFVWKPEEIPLYGLLWSPGFAVWVFLFIAGLFHINTKKRESLLLVPMFVIWLTLLAATPVHAELRYIYGIFITIPLLFVISLYPNVS